MALMTSALSQKRALRGVRGPPAPQLCPEVIAQRADQVLPSIESAQQRSTRLVKRFGTGIAIDVQRPGSLLVLTPGRAIADRRTDLMRPAGLHTDGFGEGPSGAGGAPGDEARVRFDDGHAFKLPAAAAIKQPGPARQRVLHSKALDVIGDYSAPMFRRRSRKPEDDRPNFVCGRGVSRAQTADPGPRPRRSRASGNRPH